jgi:hypothetical protein
LHVTDKYLIYQNDSVGLFTLNCETDFSGSREPGDTTRPAGPAEIAQQTFRPEMLSQIDDTMQPVSGLASRFPLEIYYIEEKQSVGMLPRLVSSHFLLWVFG